MAQSPRGLGRGLDALLGGYKDGPGGPGGPGAGASADTAGEVRSIALDAIIPNPAQPRRHFNEAALAELAESIRHQGVLQPILVRPLKAGRYELVAGERRWRASRMAGLAEVPALVREMSEEQSLAIALIENLQREDLNPVEEARGYKELQDRFGLSQEELAQRVGKSRSAVANSLRLLQLGDEVLDDIEQERLSAGHARALMSVSDPDVRQELRMRIREIGLSVRQAEGLAQGWKQTGQLPEDAPATPVRGVRGKRKSAEAGGGAEATPDHEALAELAREVSQALDGLRVSASGSQDKGRISLHFATAEELELLRARLLGPA